MSGLAFPDALSVAPAAGANGCVLLPVNGDRVNSSVLTEVTRLNPSSVTFVGGTGAVPEVSAQAIMAATHGASQKRLSGTNRFATSAAVSASGAFPSSRPEVFVASGRAYPDALTIAAVAGARKAPLLLTDTGSLPGPIGTEIRRLPTPRAIIAGGTGAVNETVAAAIKAALR
ncbi:cell wall-binding repeat-containing protein [Ornithinimicrobium sp. Y1847]|uniref:cell wall-binding repeat-containing protein n=1 Tax=Ornithinimicrobium sp. Y1847 TaxID=3405419 RepID=UPI003B66C6CE